MSARVLDCPQCGAPVTFRSSIAVFAVCEQCRSMVVLRGADLELIGVMAALPPDLSPFQIGARGEWKGRGFEIIGRIRVEWEQGSWNEWCILYDANTTGWLAEAQGLLAISFAAEVAETIPTDRSFFASNLQLKLNGAPWTVVDVKTATYSAGEGELPFPAPPDVQRVSVDLTNAKGGFASLELSEDGPELYVGEYAKFDALKLSNLRPVPGWSTEVEQEKNRTTALACPSCGAVVDLRAAGQSMSAVCGACGAVIDTATPELKLIQEADAAVRKLSPEIPIGQRGKLFDVEYEVIGFVARADQYSKWAEYLLFNPWKGFRWLVTFNGHWSFIDRLPALPAERGTIVELGGHTYQLFAKGKATVTGVLGEFYWKVQRGEQTEVADYIAPPLILSKESYPGLNEVAWSAGQYVEPKVIGEAFALKDLQRPKGIYLNQPNKFAARWKEVRMLFLLAVCALCLVQCASCVQRREVNALESSFVFDRTQPTPPPQPGRRPFAAAGAAVAGSGVASDTQKMLVTPRFTLNGGPQRVVIEATAPVSNSWLGLDIDLVNAKTNASFPAPLEISAYSGYDSEGSWSEGSQHKEVALAGVPAGEYFLTIEPSADPKVQKLPFTVRVKTGGVFNSNFILMLGLVLLYPAILLWRKSTFEKARWADSDYSS